MFTQSNELGTRVLDFLRDINKQKETPESPDVDDLMALFSQHLSPEYKASQQKIRTLEKALWKVIQVHDAFVADPSESKAFEMKDMVDMFRGSFTTARIN